MTLVGWMGGRDLRRHQLILTHEVHIGNSLLVSAKLQQRLVRFAEIHVMNLVVCGSILFSLIQTTQYSNNTAYQV